MGLEYWADTSCSGKHAYVDEVFEGKSVNITGFTSTFGSIDDLPISHVLYAFDKEDETLVLLEQNNTVYMLYDMIDSLDNPIHCEDNDVIFDLHPKLYNTNNYNTQSINFPDGASIPVEYDGLIPCIAVRKTTK